MARLMYNNVCFHLGQHLNQVLRGASKVYESSETIHVLSSTKDEQAEEYAKQSLELREPLSKRRIRSYDSVCYRRFAHVDVLYANLLAVRASGGDLGEESTAVRKRLYSDFRRLVNGHVVHSIVVEIPEVGSSGDEGWTAGEVLAFLAESGYALWWQVLRPSAIDNSPGRQRMVVFATLGSIGILPFGCEEVLMPSVAPSPPKSTVEDREVVKLLAKGYGKRWEPNVNKHTRNSFCLRNIGTQGGEGYYGALFSIVRDIREFKSMYDTRERTRARYVMSIRDGLLLEK